jgi:epoxyqueuosine reductase
MSGDHQRAREWKNCLAEQARDLGFEVFGVAAVPESVGEAYFLQWIAEGQHGEMAWMAREPERRTRPSRVLPEARSIVVVGLNYYQKEPARRGRIAKYALGGDYHKLMLKRLKRMCSQMREWGGAQKPYVDTGPVLEKPLAALAGLGWQAKNTLTINRKQGQWLFLGVILTTLDLPADEPEKERCGSCTRCLDICPTNAITAPFQLDARKCLSYLTIEHAGPIPLEYRRPLGDHLYGCDDCLDICPWNRWATETREAKFAARPLPDLRTMLGWTEDEFAEALAGSPMKRSGLRRWKRNASVVLGNIGDGDDLPALGALAQGADEMLAEHATWAISEIKNRLSLPAGIADD